MSLSIELKLHGDGDTYREILGWIVGPKRESLIDLCCCHAPNTSQMGFKKRVYVDVVQRGLDVASENQYFVLADVLGDHPIFNETYQVSTCLDGIEHISKEAGTKLLERMQAISEKQVLFTPLDPWCMDEANPDPESHKSVWKPEDLPGWASVVMPYYHELLGIGAWFFWKCPEIEKDFDRVKKLVQRKYK
jgi:hypothetical protein